MIFDAPNAAGNTLGNRARDIIANALRKITGIAEDMSADQARVGLEALNDLVAQWQGNGMDLGLDMPLALETPIDIPDKYLSAMKANLAIALADVFDRQVTPSLQRQAVLGHELVKRSLKATYTVEYY